jgi:WD40 repeat protein
VRVLQGERGRIDLVQLSHDATALVAGMWSGLQLWPNMQEATAPRLQDTIRYASSLAFHPRRDWLYVAGVRLMVCNVSTDAWREVPLWQKGGVRFAIHPDGSRIIVGQEYGGFSHFIAVRLTDEAHTQVWQRAVDHLHGQMHFLRDGGSFLRFERQPVSGSRRWYRFVVHAAESGEVLLQSGRLLEEPEGSAVSPEGNTVACRTSKRIHIYPVQDSATRPLQTLKNDGRKHFTGVAFHPSGRYLAATSNDQTVKLYDTATWAVARTFTWDIGRMRSIAFSPDGTLAAAGSDTGKVVVWDVDV